MTKDRYLKVTASGKGMIADYHTLREGSPRKFIGYEFVSNIGNINPVTGQFVGAFVLKTEPETLYEKHYKSAFIDYVRAVKDGTLLPDDEYTASICGVKYNKTKE